MDNPGELDPSEVISGVIEKALDSEPVRNLLGPVTKNVGLILGYVSDIFRFYTEQNLTKIFEKWADQRQGKPLDSEEFRRVLPLLQGAAMQSDDELQDRWAALLESTATDTGNVLPSFGQTLSQITSEEARYLDRIWKSVTSPSPYTSTKRTGREELSHYALQSIYDPKLRAPSPAEIRVYRDRMSPEQLAAFDEMTKLELMLHDFERLGLLRRETEFSPGRVTNYRMGAEQIPVAAGDSGLKISYAFTQYAVNFILAVKPKRDIDAGIDSAST